MRKNDGSLSFNVISLPSPTVDENWVSQHTICCTVHLRNVMLRTRFWSVQAFCEQQVQCIFPLPLITALSSVFVARVCQIFLVNCDVASATFIIIVLLLLFTEYFLFQPYFRWPLIRVVSHHDGLLGWS